MRDDFGQRFQERMEARRARWEGRMDNRGGHGGVWTGLLLLIIGAVALLRSFNFPMPVWFYTWQMLLIGIGLFSGFRHGFRNSTWFILIFIGGAFLVNDYFIEGNLRQHIWPLVLILIGIMFILKPRRHYRYNMETGFEKKSTVTDAANSGFTSESSSRPGTGNADDFLNVTSIFSGTKKNILSKNFQGGDVVNIFGGTELNMNQADINGTAVMDFTNIFGGTKLIVPSNWSVKSEAGVVFGGIEDKRNLPPGSGNPDKLLLIRGTVLFGGIEIKSY